MTDIVTIFRRELSQYFVSPLAYLIAAAFLLLTGITFNNDVTLSIGNKPANPSLIPDLLSFLLIIMAPLLTMRSIAEENREGTIELLLTAPISDHSIVIGKFLGAYVYYTILLWLTLLYQLILVSITMPDLAHTIGAYLGIWLYGGATLAIGIIFSASTENQILAAFMTMATLFLLYFGESVGLIVANADLARIIFALTLQGHYVPSFSIGIVRAEDIVYYCGLMVIALYIAMQIVRMRRWR